MASSATAHTRTLFKDSPGGANGEEGEAAVGLRGNGKARRGLKSRIGTESCFALDDADKRKEWERRERPRGGTEESSKDNVADDDAMGGGKRGRKHSKPAKNEGGGGGLSGVEGGNRVISISA